MDSASRPHRNGLYVNYGLKALNIHGGQKLTLAEHGGAYGATADMSAKIGGEGDLAINTVRQVSLSNGQNDYQGQPTFRWGHYVPMRMVHLATPGN